MTRAKWRRGGKGRWRTVTCAAFPAMLRYRTERIKCFLAKFDTAHLEPESCLFGPSVLTGGFWSLYTQGRRQFDHTGVLVCRKEIWFFRMIARQKYGALYSNHYYIWSCTASIYILLYYIPGYAIQDPVAWQFNPFNKLLWNPKQVPGTVTGSLALSSVNILPGREERPASITIE